MLPPAQQHLAATPRQDGVAEHAEIGHEFAALKKLGLVLMSEMDVPRLLKSGSTLESQQHHHLLHQQQQQALLPPSARHACASCSQEFDSRLALSIHVGRVHKEYGATAYGPSSGRAGVTSGDDGGGVEADANASKRNHTCTLCDKSFFSASYLSQHLRIHSGLKPYTCQVCLRNFTQLSHLQQHRRTHTGERPYKCKHPGCVKAFSQLSNLQSHSRSHMTDKTYKCTSCYKCFLDKDSLLGHVATHLGTRRVRAYACHLCDKSYTQDTYLQNHIKVKHAAGGNGGSGEKPKAGRTSATLLASSAATLQHPMPPGVDGKSTATTVSFPHHRLATGNGGSASVAHQPSGQLHLQRATGKTHHQQQQLLLLPPSSPAAGGNVHLERLGEVGGATALAIAVAASADARYGGHAVHREQLRQQHFLRLRDGSDSGCSIDEAEEPISAQPLAKVRQVSGGPPQRARAVDSTASDGPTAVLRPGSATTGAPDRASSRDLLLMAGMPLEKTPQTVAVAPPTVLGQASRTTGDREKSPEYGSAAGSPLSMHESCKPDAIGGWSWGAAPIATLPGGGSFSDAVSAAAGYSLPYHMPTTELQSLQATLTSSSSTLAASQHDQFRWSSCAAEPEQQQQQRGSFTFSSAYGSHRALPSSAAFGPPYWLCADGPYRQVAAAGALGFGLFGGSSNSSTIGQSGGGSCSSVGFFDGLSGAVPSPYGLAMAPSGAVAAGYADHFAHQPYHLQPQSEALALTKLASHSSPIGGNGGAPGAGGGLVFHGI